MKLLIITQYFWPESFRINDLVQELQKRGHKITVFTGLPNYPSGKIFSGYCKFCWLKENYNGISITRVPIVPRGKGTRIQLVLNYISFVIFSCLSAPFFLRSEYDLIFVYEPSPITVCYPAILIKKLKKIPIILWVQDLWPESLSATGAINSTYFLKIIGYIVKYIYKACDLILVQSKAFIPSIKRFGVYDNSINYYPNSAEKLYRPIDRNDAKYSDQLPDGFRVIFAGNIGSAQSMETILEAANILKSKLSIQWIILGDGRKKKWMGQEIVKLQLKSTVHLIGERPLEDMPHYFAQADILLATLKRDPIFSSTIPSKVQSYFACGKAIVAAIDGETASVIQESGGGISVPAENADELAKAVLKMYNIPDEERKKMGLRGRKYFEENFESEKLINQLEHWMIELV